MGALIKACNVSLSLKNTGIECSTAMLATAMIVAMPAGLKWTNEDMEDFTAYINEQMHAAGAARVYPLFGNNAPIRSITNNDEDDVVETYDDGSQSFVRSGYANRVFITDKGGLCYAAALRSFINSGYAFIEIDKSGNVAMKKNADGTYSGFQSNMGGKTPIPADFKSAYKNRFQLTYDPTTYINNGEIFTGAEGVLDLMGLIDSEVFDAEGSSTTILKVGVKTVCAETDLVALLGDDLAVAGNFVVKDNADSSVITPSAVAIVGGHIEITGTFPTGNYNVALAASTDLFDNGIEGYEGTVDVDIAIA